MFFSGDFHWYLLSSNFNKNFEPFSFARAKIGYAVTLIDNFSLNLISEGGFKLGEPGTTSLDFVLGGFGNDFINNYIPFVGYDFLSIAGDSFVNHYTPEDF